MSEPVVPRAVERTENNNISAEEADLTLYSIERVQTEVFHWGGYRYSTARDAIAAAKRANAR